MLAYTTDRALVLRDDHLEVLERLGAAARADSRERFAKLLARSAGVKPNLVWPRYQLAASFAHGLG